MKPNLLLLVFSVLVPLVVPASEVPAQSEPTVKVAAAAHDIPAGTVLGDNDIIVLELPKSLATKSVVEFEDARAYLVKQVVSVPLLKGDWMQWSMFAMHVREVGPLCVEAAKSGGDPRQEVARMRTQLRTTAKK